MKELDFQNELRKDEAKVVSELVSGFLGRELKKKDINKISKVYHKDYPNEFGILYGTTPVASVRREFKGTCTGFCVRFLIKKEY